MLIDPGLLTSAFLLGLAGAGHCLGMCGGIAAALNLGGPRSVTVTVAYHGGRVASYALLGALVGWAAGSIDLYAWTVGLRYLAGFLLIAMGLSIGNWWQGVRVLERAGAVLWTPVQRLSARWLPIRHWGQSLALGLCWGLMPCGLIYSSLAWAATSQNAATAAVLMGLFGIGTLPAMMVTSFGAQQVQALLRNTRFRRVIAVFLILAGVWTLYLVIAHGGHLSQKIHTDSVETATQHTHH